MKTQHLIATLVVAATLPLGIVRAEAPNTPEGTTGKQEQNSDQSGIKRMMCHQQAMSAWRDREAELDKLMAEMNSASPDKRLDSVAAVVTALVEQRRAINEQMQKMMSGDEKEGRECCQMMMSGGHDPQHADHH
jgi:hypothetical protein